MLLSARILFAWFVLYPFLIFLLPGSWRLQAVDIYFPSVTALLSWIFFRGQSRSSTGKKRNLLFCWFIGGVCFVASLISIPIGYKLGWAYFSYGAMEPSPSLLKTIFCLKIPLAILVVWLGYEWTLRGVFWSSLDKHLGFWPTLLMTSLVGFHLQWPRLVLSNGSGEFMYCSATLAELFFVELLCGVLVAMGGRLAPSILFHSMVLISERFLLGDILNPYMPLTNYVSSNPQFYVFKALFLLLFLSMFTMGLYLGRKLKRH